MAAGDWAPPERRKNGLAIHDFKGKLLWWCQFCDGKTAKKRRREVPDTTVMYEQWDAHKTTQQHREAEAAYRDHRRDVALVDRVANALDRSSSGEPR